MPEKTTLVLVASGMNVKYPVLSSNPKKPTFAAVPLCQRNSIPRSLLSSEAGAVSPPRVKIGSSTVTVVELTVVVVPLIVRLPVTDNPPETVTMPVPFGVSVIPMLVSVPVAEMLGEFPSAALAIVRSLTAEAADVNPISSLPLLSLMLVVILGEVVDKLVTVVRPVPFGVSKMLPFVSVDDMVFPLRFRLSTVKDPTITGLVYNSVKFELTFTKASLSVSPVLSFGAEPTLMFCCAI